MKYKLNQMPFTREKSYMVFSEVQENYRNLKNEAGLYMRTIHSSCHTPLVARIDFMEDQKKEIYEYALEHTALVFSREEKKIECCFADADTVLLRGSKGSRMCLDFLTETGAYDYIYDIRVGEHTYYMANCYKNNCRYLIWVQQGEISLDQQWEESTSLYSRLYVGGEEGFLMVLQEIETEWDRVERTFDFDSARDRTEKEFLEFLEKTPSVPEKYEEVRYLAAYLNWSSIVRADGFMKRDAMYMSKNWMTNVWSWDHCFNAIALAYENSALAWDQFMILFDFQDSSGLLPDSISDVHIVWNYCKPPVHGWALAKMMEHMALTQEQMRQAFGCLEKWTLWWMNYRRRDGLFFYNHGNDSGWDNSTAFSVLPPVATPELQADMILQMEVLADLAGRLQEREKQELWAEEADRTLKIFLEKCFRDGLPVAIQLNTGTIVENDSLLPMEILILGDRLPAEIRENIIRVVKSEKFYTAHGFATESPASPLYRADGYWRGPIWAPSTLLMVDGLKKCGEDALAMEASEKFAQMVSVSGFAENFNALTGEGLRDRAYTWTASVFLILAHEYLS